MDTSIRAAICACFCLVIAACGSSSSNKNDDNQLKTTDENDLYSHCLNYPEDASCQKARESGTLQGFDDYYQGNGKGYSDADFNGAAGFCGCNNGNSVPVLYGQGMNAERFCEPASVSQRSVRGNRVQMRYRDNGGGSKLNVKFDYFDGSETSVYGGNQGGPCQEYGEVRVANQSGCDGTGVPSQYTQIPGRSYGYCQEPNGQNW